MNESAGQTVSPYTRLNTAVKEWSKEKMPVKAKYTTASNLARVVVLKVCIQLLMLQVTLVGNVFCGNVLIWPTEASHWLSIKVIIEEMIHRGHNVSILLSTGSLFIKPSDVPAAKFEMYPVPFGKDAIDTLIKDIIMLWLFNRPTAFTFHKFYQELGTLVSKANDLNRQMCEGVLANQELMVQLQRRKYDVLISDPVTICGDLVAVKLEIPFVYTLRFTPASTVERHCGKIPAPPSYAPAVLSELTDRLSFPERVKNMISYHVQDYVFQSCWGEWDSYYSQVLDLLFPCGELVAEKLCLPFVYSYRFSEGNTKECFCGLLPAPACCLGRTNRQDVLYRKGRPTTLCEIMGKAEMWLIRTYWDLEFPRPYLPNFEFVGGLHCQPAKPLPEEMEEFVQSSEEHGIVVFSLGSMVQNLTDEKSNMVALALSQIPQKVIWRYKGKWPETLGPNTRLYDWIPQNDLLGHSKTKAFITHGGTNGIYEAIYHGIPMVGIPIFADQPDNIAHMKAKGMAVEVDFHTMTAKDLVNALSTVIHNTTYKENAVRLSQIHHDQPIKPLERAIFWIEFVMRHKGAKHLRPAAHHLTWYQYHCLDVIAFLTGCLAVLIFLAVKCCSFCCHKCGRVIRKTKTE